MTVEVPVYVWRADYICDFPKVKMHKEASHRYGSKQELVLSLQSTRDMKITNLTFVRYKLEP